MAATQPGTRHQQADTAGVIDERNQRGQMIDTVATGLGNGVGTSVGWLAEHGILFLLFAVLWVAFGAALIWSQGSLDAAWQTIRDLPLLAQIIVWILFLPVTAGLWIWETSWPLVLRLVLIAGVAWVNLLTFLPRALRA